MKNLFSFVVLVALIALLAVVLSGCSTPTTICEFDKDGKMTKKTVTERDAIDKITDSTKDKTVIAWSDGWIAYVSVSTATTEDPTPTGKISAGKVAKGYISLLKDQKNLNYIANIIYATKSDLTVTTDGIISTSSKTENQKEADAAEAVKD